MDNLEEMYNDIIMEHSMNSYNKKKLDECDFCQKGHNPNCGDEINIEVKLKGDVIENMAFTGHRLCNFSKFYFYYDRCFERQNNS